MPTFIICDGTVVIWTKSQYQRLSQLANNQPIRCDGL
jgi:hypothetical protein